MDNATNRIGEANKAKVFDRVVVSHDRACGHVAEVFAVTRATFSARCECGWKFTGQHKDGYRKV